MNPDDYATVVTAGYKIALQHLRVYCKEQADRYYPNGLSEYGKGQEEAYKDVIDKIEEFIKEKAND